MRDEIREVSAPTFRADIFIAGSREAATQACREFCLEGLCVTISEIDFVYTGGMESGVRVGLINYPRFPANVFEIKATACRLARFLIERLHQGSCSVVTDASTVWLTRREFD